MPNDSNEYWFPAKRYGWGWGFPSRWQGWMVLAIYAVLLVVGIVGLHLGRTQLGFRCTSWAFQCCWCWFAGGRASRRAGAGGVIERRVTVSNLDGRQSGSYSTIAR